MNALDRRAGGEIVEEERDLHDHALGEPTDGGGKKRCAVKQPMGLHFRHMLVLQRQSIKEVVRGQMLG